MFLYVYENVFASQHMLPDVSNYDCVVLSFYGHSKLCHKADKYASIQLKSTVFCSRFLCSCSLFLLSSF